jgi:hypothetical protein
LAQLLGARQQSRLVYSSALLRAMVKPSVQIAPVEFKKISRDVKYLTPSCCIDGVQSSPKKLTVSFAHPMMWKK